MTEAPSTPTTTASPPPFTSDASRTVTTEHLALIGFAARLGTAACVNNDETKDAPDSKSVRDEAMLLMSLLMGEKAEEILSEEIGFKESRSEKRKKSRPTDTTRDMGNFSFTFPSLSLQPDDAVTEDAEITAGPPSEDGEGEVPEDGDPPSKLLGRTQSVHDKADGIRDSSESMARNVLESFGAALVWRAKTWIKSLAKVLALKEQERIEALGAAAAMGGGTGGGGEADQEDQDDEEGGEDDSSQEDEDNANDALMNSKEMQIIDAIVKSSEEVSVVNIKTAFRVLPNRVSPKNSDVPVAMQDQEDGTQQEQPASKKAKKGEESDPQDAVREYKVTHRLLFEATISMTSNDGVRYNGVQLQAPGYIQGTFTSKAGSTTKGEETLTGVSMTLDTDALALSLERQSRLVVRKAAEAALVAAGGLDGASSPRITDSPHVQQSIISPRYVLMSPMPANPSESPMTLPPVPTVGEGGGPQMPSASSPRVVSSSEGHSSDDSQPSVLSLKPLGKKTPSTPTESPSFPILLSVANEELTRGEEALQA